MERSVKSRDIRTLEKLLDVAGATTSWSLIAIELRKMRTAELAALRYRVERAIADAYDTGERAGRVVDDR